MARSVPFAGRGQHAPAQGSSSRKSSRTGDPPSRVPGHPARRQALIPVQRCKGEQSPQGFREPRRGPRAAQDPHRRPACRDFRAGAAAGRIPPAPGITYERQLLFTPHGPEVIHVMIAPKPGGLYALHPVLSNNTVIGRERVTSMQKRMSSTATVGGVNADLFTFDEGLPSGMFMQSGVLTTPPHPKRSTVGVTDDGGSSSSASRCSARGRASVTPSAERPQPAPGPEGVSLFTPAWGPATPAAQRHGRDHARRSAARRPVHGPDRDRRLRQAGRRDADSARRSGARRRRHLCGRLASEARSVRRSPPGSSCARSGQASSTRSAAARSSSRTGSPCSARSSSSRAASSPPQPVPRSASARTGASSS